MVLAHWNTCEAAGLPSQFNISADGQVRASRVPLLGGDGWESEQLLAIGGHALNGCYYSNHWALDFPDPRLQGFLERESLRGGRRVA